MIPKEAIEKAIAEGWRPTKDEGDALVDRRYGLAAHFTVSNNGDLYNITRSWNDIALDPSFWQSLGKALGWAEIHTIMYHPSGDQNIPEWQQKSALLLRPHSHRRGYKEVLGGVIRS